MSFSYPYASALKSEGKTWREGRDYVLWQTGTPLEERVSHAHGPIIEIGGPTEAGFYFLEGMTLPSRPIITNFSSDPVPYAEHAEGLAEAVEQIVDGTHMPYEDGSVAIFLVAGMSLSSDWWVRLDDKEKEQARPKFEKEFDLAKLETGQVAIGVMNPEGAVHAQRVQIYREVQRCLAKDGLLFANGRLEDIVVLKRLGFELVAFLQYQIQDPDSLRWQHAVQYEFVVRK